MWKKTAWDNENDELNRIQVGGREKEKEMQNGLESKKEEQK